MNAKSPGLRLVERSPAPEATARLPEVDWSILMARAQAGDQAAYRRLLGELVPFLRALAAAAHRDGRDIEDTVQDVLLTLHQVRHTYDPARPFGPWLVAIARRRIVDRLRRQGRARRHETPLEPDHETLTAAAANQQETQADAATIHHLVERLPPAQREAIRLMKLQELSLREAAEASGMSVAALKVATHRGLKTLRKLLTGGQDRP